MFQLETLYKFEPGSKVIMNGEVRKVGGGLTCLKVLFRHSTGWMRKAKRNRSQDIQFFC